MDDLNLDVIVLDAGGMAEDTNYAHLDLVSRIRDAVIRFQQEGLQVLLVDCVEDHWDQLQQEPAIDFHRCGWIQAYNEPTILDTLEAVERYGFSLYATCFDVDLIADWRVPHGTQEWLQKYRQTLEVTFSFDKAGFHPIWPSTRNWSLTSGASESRTFADVLDAKILPEKASNKCVQPDGLRSFYPPGKPKSIPSETVIVKESTGWYSESPSSLPNGGGPAALALSLAVLPLKVHGGLQLVLAILAHNEKEPLLQNAASLCSGLSLDKCEEEEDFQHFIQGIQAPWPDHQYTSHVVSAVGGELDGLWVVGTGSRKMARRRAAKLALVVAERAAKQSSSDWDELDRLVDRAKVLMEHARTQHALEVECEVLQNGSAASWLSFDPAPPTVTTNGTMAGTIAGSIAGGRQGSHRPPATHDRPYIAVDV